MVKLCERNMLFYQDRVDEYTGLVGEAETALLTAKRRASANTNRVGASMWERWVESRERDLEWWRGRLGVAVTQRDMWLLKMQKAQEGAV